MPVTPTYPGVYIEELPSGVHPITGVATSIAAFVDFFARGPMNEAVQLFGFADFERTFGGLDARSEASYAIQQFFLNGGGEAWAVRVAGGNPIAATTVIRKDAVGGATALTVSAASEGAWGARVRVRIDQVAGMPSPTFNLAVTEYDAPGAVAGARPLRSETLLNLSMSTTSVQFVDDVVKRGSTLVRTTASGNDVPLANGTTSGEIGASVTLSTGEDLPAVSVTIDGTTAKAVLPEKPSGAVTITKAAALLTAAIRGARPDLPTFANATVDVVGTRLRIRTGGGMPSAVFAVAADAADTTTAKELKLTDADGAVSNVQEYVLGGGAVANTGQAAGAAGDDGSAPDANALIGSGAVDPPTGMNALEKVDLFSILCLPRIARLDGDKKFDAGQVGMVVTSATAYCERRRALLLLDTPTGVATVTGARNWLTTTVDALRHKNVAAYFPRLLTVDPLSDFRPKSVGASGTVAGLFARTDADRGVWKAPAGVDATVRNVLEPEAKLTDAENGVLNPLGLNCVRTFPIFGHVCWGARTLEGADQQASEWKYVPVRRVALFLEESLYRGTKWVVFEPNDESLWAQIRLNVGAFMHDLFRLGAFQGTTPKQAYLVKCDSETTTQTDIDHGIVNIVVGFAPLKPAEFVIVQIQQLAGQIET